MTLTRHARAVAAALQEQRELAQREEYRQKLLRLQQAFEPPLSNAELSAGLGLGAPSAGEVGISEVARFLSESPRWRKARPDGATRAAIDCLLEGRLHVAVRAPMPGARREVLLCEDRDVALLGAGFKLHNLGGRELPQKRQDWEDSALWDLFEERDKERDKRDIRDKRDQEREVPVRVPDVPDVPFVPFFSPALGAMRLSTTGRPTEADALALLQKALEAGIRFLDTADSYCLDDTEVGHNELLLSRALRAFPGASPTVATKAGLRRPGGKWIPDGRPAHLRASCEASLGRLEVPTLELFQLHVPDPKVPFLDSVGELARLREEGKIRHLGLSNIDLQQLTAARGVAPIASVQNALSFFDTAALRSGLWQACRERGTLLIAHSPLGGHRDVHGQSRAERDPVLREIAARHGLTVHQIALAWLRSWPGVLPIPGATTWASLEANLAIEGFQLEPSELAALDQRAVARSRGGAELPPRSSSAVAPAASPPASPIVVTEFSAGAPGAAEEVVLFIGPPAAGKTSRVEPFLLAGYERLNRDLLGGKLENLLPLLRRRLQEGCRRFVLDNTYATREQRRGVLQIAREAGLPARGIHLDVPVEEALYNACLRMLERQGKILSPEEIKSLSRRDPNLLPPAAIYRFFEIFEPPSLTEGFSSLERIPFERRYPSDYHHRALLVDIDGTVRGTRDGAPFPRHPDDVVLLPHRRETLLRYQEQGYLLLGVSNQAHIGLGQVSDEVARACFDRMLELLGFPFEIHYCPHPPTPAGVWARKPMPGLGVLLIEKHRLDRRACTFVGDQDVDRLFAKNAGFQFRTPEEIFVAVDESP